MEHFDSSIIEPIEMRMVKPSPFEVRHKIDKKSSEFRSLVKSITEHGLLQPILVRPVSHGFEIVAGYRRFEACRSLRWRHIQSKIRELTDKQTYEIQLTENIQRQSLSPLEEAEAFKVYVDDFGWGGVSELANKIEKSEEYVSHRIQLLKLPSTAKKQLMQNTLSVSQSLELLGIPSDEQGEMVRRITDENLTIKQIRSIKKSKVSNKDPLETKKEQSSRITKKTKLGLKMALSRIDSVANEAHIISDPKIRSEVVTYMMDLRYKLHELLDDTIHFERVTLKKNLKL
jgi:ParB family chromosome partitioning protein